MTIGGMRLSGMTVSGSRPAAFIAAVDRDEIVL